LRDVVNLSAIGRVGAGSARHVREVAGGSIHLETGGGKHDLKIKLEGVEGELLGGAEVAWATGDTAHAPSPARSEAMSPSTTAWCAAGCATWISR